MKKIYFTLLTFLVCYNTMAQNSLLTNPVLGSINSIMFDDLEIVANNTDVILVLASESESAFYAIDIDDNNSSEAMSNELTEIDNFTTLIESAIGVSNPTLVNFEVNPISHSIWVLVKVNTTSYVVKITENGSQANVLDLSSITYSMVNWNGSMNYASQDITKGEDAIYLTSGAWNLDGEIGVINLPVVHNSNTSNRASTMFKTNWGGNYFTDAPLERMDLAVINNEERLLGVTVCAPGFSIKTDDISGTGVLEVKEEFNVTFNPPLKVVHQIHNDIHYLYDLHGDFENKLIRIGQEFIDGSPIDNNEFNNNVIPLRNTSGLVSPGLTEEQVKIFSGTYSMIAFWNNCNLLVLQNDTLKLLETNDSENCVEEEPSSINSYFNNKYISVYPNPTKDFININVDLEEFNAVTLEIKNLLGAVIFKTSLNEGDNKISIEDFSNGIYIVELKSEDKIIHSSKIQLAK